MSMFNGKQLVQQARAGLGDALGKAHASFTKREQQFGSAVHPGQADRGAAQYTDLTIQFIGADGLPKMDVGGLADPYFRASLDDKLKYISTVKETTLQPVWNELWLVKNVPTTARLEVVVFDKDVGPSDDVIGRFNVDISPGAKEAKIEGIVTRRAKGTFWLKIEWRDPTHPIDVCPPYSFDGPVRYSSYKSPTVGLLAAINDERLYSTWKIYIKGVPQFFGDTTQGWNRDYPAAQRIFGTMPDSIALRSAIRSAHSILYARTTRNAFGTVETADDALGLFRGTTRGQGRRERASSNLASPFTSPPGSSAGTPGGANSSYFNTPTSPNRPGTGRAPPQRIKPAIYTYVIADKDSSLRFSETGAAFLVDFASKHALHSNCAEVVRYSGEFHLRPAIPGGWSGFHDDTPDDRVPWELVVDNNSGTYAPNKDELWRVRGVLEYNLPGLRVVAHDRSDQELKDSVQATRDYALKFRGVAQQELQPHLGQQGGGGKSMQQMIKDGELKPQGEEFDEGAGSIRG